MSNVTQQELRVAVKDLHDQAETTQLARDLISGNIDPLIYKNYCYQLFLIADAIESNVKLRDELNRKYSLINDIAESPTGAVKACASTVEYVTYLNNQHKPQLHGQYKGHIYTHYLGWLYGGQMIAKKLNLPKHHLEFDNVKECVDYVRNIQLGYLIDRDVE